MTEEDITHCLDWALCKAAAAGDNETVSALLDAGADVHAWTDASVWMAGMMRHADTMRALLDAGADHNVALAAAAEFGLTELVTELLAKGADVHTCEGLPLLMAAENGYADTVRVLKDWRKKLKHGKSEIAPKDSAELAE